MEALKASLAGGRQGRRRPTIVGGRKRPREGERAEWPREERPAKRRDAAARPLASLARSSHTRTASAHRRIDGRARHKRDAGVARSRQRAAVGHRRQRRAAVVEDAAVGLHRRRLGLAESPGPVGIGCAGTFVTGMRCAGGSGCRSSSRRQVAARVDHRGRARVDRAGRRRQRRCRAAACLHRSAG